MESWMSVRYLVPHPAVGQKEAGDRAKSWLGKNKKGGAIKLRTTYYSYRNSVQHRATTVNMNPTNPSTGEILINNTPQIADTVAPSQQHHPLLLLRTRMEAPHSTTAAQQNRGCRHYERGSILPCRMPNIAHDTIAISLQERRCRGETVSCHQLSQDRSQGEDLKREQDPSSS